MHSPFLYVSGGCRSGKSAYARRWVETACPSRVHLATALPNDEETAARIRQHRDARGRGWATLDPAPSDWDEPELLARRASALGGALLLDCLTLWTSGCLRRDMTEESILSLADRLLLALRATRLPVALVSNELGMGLVPEDAAAQSFRDLAGLVNQKAASASDAVVLMVSGQPLRVR